MTSFTVLLAISLLAASPTASRAADYARSGFYASLGGVYAVDLYEDDVEDALGSGVDVDVDATGGLSARLGVRVLKMLAVEVQYEWLDEYDIAIRVPEIGQTATVELMQHTLTANARVFFPIWRVQPYLLAGVGFQRLEYDARATVLGLGFTAREKDTVLAGRVGAGVEVALTEHVAVFGEGMVVLTNEEIEVPGGEDIDGIFYAGASAGLTLRF